MHIERDIHHEICPQIFAVIQENTEISFNFDARYVNEILRAFFNLERPGDTLGSELYNETVGVRI